MIGCRELSLWRWGRDLEKEEQERLGEGGLQIIKILYIYKFPNMNVTIKDCNHILIK